MNLGPTAMRRPGLRALAGCVLVGGSPAVSARDVKPTESVAGAGPVDLRFLATDEPGGPPLPGVTVAVVRVPQDRTVSVAAWREGGRSG